MFCQIFKRIISFKDVMVLTFAASAVFVTSGTINDAANRDGISEVDFDWSTDVSGRTVSDGCPSYRRDQ